MKSFSKFIKEEIDLRGNTGIPDDFMSKSDRQAERNLGIRVDNDMRKVQSELGPQIMQLSMRSDQIMLGGRNRMNPEQLEERWLKLEELAKNIVLDEFNEILEASDKPVELIIKLLRPWLRQTVSNEIPEMSEIPAKVDQEIINDLEIKKSIDKKKLLNSINQGYAKTTKDIIQLSERVKPALDEIFGNDADAIYQLWLEISDVANRLDWAFPIDIKSDMMKDRPEGLAGACKVEWEKEEEQEDEDDEIEVSTYDPDNDKDESEDESEDFTKILIKSVARDFPMLIHETVKGIFQLLQSGAIKDDEELAKLIAKNTESFEDESQDFRYGPIAQKMLREFVLSCNGCDRYSNMDVRVYAKLALDKDRGGNFTDEEFLEITKGIFGSFDLNNSGATLDFELNQERFNTSLSKTRIERVISDIISAEREYENELSKWEMDTEFSKNDDNNYDDEGDDEGFDSFLADNGIGKSNTKPVVEEEEEDDIDSLLDKLSDAKTQAEKDSITRKLNKLMESMDDISKLIYSKEVTRIVENKRYR